MPPETVPGGALLDAADPEVYVELLSNCGYQDVECHAKEKPILLENLEVLIEAGWIIAGLDAQPQDVQNQIEAGVRERAASFRNADGSYTFPDIVLAARAIA